MSILGRNLFEYIFSNFVWYNTIHDALDKRVVCKQLAGIVGSLLDKHKNQFWVTYFAVYERKYNVRANTWHRMLSLHCICERSLVLEYGIRCMNSIKSDGIFEDIFDYSSGQLEITADGIVLWRHVFGKSCMISFANDYKLDVFDDMNGYITLPNKVTRELYIENYNFTRASSDNHWHIDRHCIYKGCFHLNGCGKKRKAETIN